MIMDLAKAIELIQNVLAQLKLTKAEHAALDQAMGIIQHTASTPPSRGADGDP